MRGVWVAGALLLVASGCGAREEETGPGISGGDEVPDPGNFVSRVYERNIVFASTRDDSVFIAPWVLRTIESPDSVTREARAWLSRGGVWDRFYSERWQSPAGGAASLVLPRGALRLLARDGDVIDGLLFEEGPRNLEVVLDEVAASWTGARGGSFEVLTGAAYLSDRRVDGMVLQMTRAAPATEAAGGDWAFLLSGDSAHFVFAADTEHGGESEPQYRGWSMMGDQEAQWPEVRFDWQRREAYPPARRDIPVEWTIDSPDGGVSGTLASVSADIIAGDGPGPLLPVEALFEVEGQVAVADTSFEVRGILVHRRR